jgi:hypothetical protein
MHDRDEDGDAHPVPAAIERADAGEKITTAVAREIIAGVKGERKPEEGGRLAVRLARSLEGYRRRWDERELADLAKRLREFADALER